MAATAAIGAFATVTIHSILLTVEADLRSMTFEDWLTNLIISILFGATFLAWWPILRKGLVKLGILW